MKWLLNKLFGREPSNDPIAVAVRRWSELPSLKP